MQNIQPAVVARSRVSSIILPISVAIHSSVAVTGSSEQTYAEYTIAPFITPPWSRDTHVAAAYIRHSNLEVMQWLAFIAMVLGNVGLMMPQWGVANATKSSVLLGIGQISFPIFAFVFAWRMASTLLRNPQHNLAGTIFKMGVCAFAAHLAWAATGEQTLVNVVVEYAGALLIIALLQEDRGWTVPLGLRWAVATIIAYWLVQNINYGAAGLILLLSVYAYLRFNDIGARNTSIAALFALTIGFSSHTAFIALPIIFLIQKSNWEIKKPFKNIFYVIYPLHIIALALTCAIFPI